MPTVSLVGSTGSIGTQAVDVIRTDPGRFDVVAIAARANVEVLAEQARELRPQVVAVVDTAAAVELKARVPAGTEVIAGEAALAHVATLADVTLNAVVGFAGLPVTLATLSSGRRLALANKESLIAGGPIVQASRATAGAEIVPVDSEHCAVHQCLQGAASGRVRRVVLTASGGPFRGRSRTEMADVTVDDALAHPTWRMGPKITIDSSTLMNKGLEVIEAHELFGISYDGIDVVVHPQSVVHSMVEFSDGATLAQLSQPDMRLPIGYALAYPDRLPVAFGAIDWSELGRLEFEQPDREAFPALGLAYRAGREGGVTPAWLSAANEVAVDAFLAGRIRWLAIADVIADTLDACNGGIPGTVEDVLEADRAARERAAAVVERRSQAA